MPVPPALPPDLDRDALVRVEAPDHPEAVAGSASASVLLAPPTDGTPWVHEAVPHPDRVVDHAALDAVNVTPWHAEGATGAGVRIAVFDLQWDGVEALAADLAPVQTHDCFLHPSCGPAMDTARPRFGFERGVHGTACAELVRMVAPEAELHLVRVTSRSMLENAVDWAIREEIDVVSMSMSFFNQSFFDGRGPIAPLVDRLRAHDILMVTSAGNYARGHWQGGWRDADADGRMDLPGGNGIDLELDRGDRVYLTWDQYGICGVTDLDLVLVDEDGAIVGRSDDEQVPPPATDAEGHRCEPLERISGVPEDGRYRLEVHLARGSTTDLLVDVMTPGGRIPDGTPRTSIVDPGLHPDVLTVGAVDVRDHPWGDVQVFSSLGPSITGLVKPDVAGPDGLTTRSYGTRGFFGTSAATPVVAGLVAVEMSREPGLGPYEAAERLKAWAWDDGSLAPRDDVRWGAGKVRMPTPAEDPGCGRRPLWLVGALPLLALARRRWGRDRSVR